MRGMLGTAVAACLLAVAAPAHAQDGAPAAAAAPAPEALSLARITVDHIWPLGTYERLMTGTMDMMSDGIVDMMLGSRLPDVDGEGDFDPGDRTMGEIVAEGDPHFEERMRITNRVMMTEMVPVLAKVEPRIREMLTNSFARKFDAQQLTDLNAFFATPTGAAYASQAMTMFVDPEFMAVMAEFTPTLLEAMPAIIEKVEAATAHLPPPPVPSDEVAAEDESL